MSFIRDTMLVFRRQERLALRQPAWVIIGLTQPILYLALFGPLLKGLPGASLGGGGNAYRFFVPGLLIQLALFGSTFVGFAIISDWRSGVIERFRVTPVNRLAIMAGRVLRDVVTLVVQAAVLVIVGVAFGLRAPLPAVLIGFVFIMFVAIGLASVSYATGLVVKSEDAFAPLINTVVVPLLLLSGIFLPLTLGPGWLQGIARISPFRYIIDAMREAYLGHYFNTIMVEGIAVAVGMAVLFLVAGLPGVRAGKRLDQDRDQQGERGQDHRGGRQPGPPGRDGVLPRLRVPPAAGALTGRAGVQADGDGLGGRQRGEVLGLLGQPGVLRVARLGPRREEHAASRQGAQQTGSSGARQAGRPGRPGAWSGRRRTAPSMRWPCRPRCSAGWRRRPGRVSRCLAGSVVHPDPFAGVHRRDGRPGHVVVAERVEDRQAGRLGDDPRSQCQRVGQPGDRHQDRRHHDREPGRRALDREVGDVGHREGDPHPPEDQRRGEPEDLAVPLRRSHRASGEDSRV